MTGLPGRSRHSVLAATFIVFTCSLLYRFLAAKFSNDDYLFLAHGRQLVAFGGWPIRDLIEEGRPLHFLASAAVQALFGYRLLGEMLLDLFMLAAAYTLTFLLATELSGSIGIGLLMATLATIASPRLYDYPKAFLPVAALWIGFRCLPRPTFGRLAWLGIFTAFVFLYRHDLGVYVGMSVVAALAAMQAARRSFSPAQLLIFSGAVTVGLIPFLLFLQLNGGIMAYLDAERRFIQRENARTASPPPAFQFDFSSGLLSIEMPRRPAPIVGVRWKADLSAESRVALERKYHLESGRPTEGPTWEYQLMDSSSQNLSSMLRDPQVEDTSRIDRSAARLAPERGSLGGLALLIPRIRPAPGVFARTNAVAWLYYVARGLPLLALVLIVARIVGARVTTGRSLQPTDDLGKVMMTVTFCAVAAPLLLRGDLDRSDRLADLACPTAVLAAWLIAAARPGIRTSSAASRLKLRAVYAADVAILIVTYVSWFAVAGMPRSELAMILQGPGALAREISVKSRNLMASPPPEEWMSAGSGVREIVRYIRACTDPEERVFVTGFFPEIYFFSGRGMSGDRSFVLPGFWNLPDEQLRTVEKMRKTGMALAIVDAGPDDGTTRDKLFADDLPIIQDYLSANYREVGRVSAGGAPGGRYHIWADKARAPVGTFQPLGLPCYRRTKGMV